MIVPVTVDFLKKSDASCLLERSLSDTHLEGSVEFLRMNGETEWKDASGDICDIERIRRETGPANSPQLKGCVEREITKLDTTVLAAHLEGKKVSSSAGHKIPRETKYL